MEHMEPTLQPPLTDAGHSRELAAALRGALEAVSLPGAGVTALDGTTNPHTDADRDAGAILTQQLTQILPGVPVVSEEDELTTPPRDGTYWLVDPLDGTLNVLRGEGAVAVSVALFQEHQCVAGAVRRLDRDEAAVAVAHQLNPDLPEARRRPERPANLVFVSFGMPARPSQELTGMVGPLRACWERDWITRQSGSAASDVLSVATGTLDAFFEQGVEPWDVAAADHIARASGCVSWTRTRSTRREGIGSIDYVVAATPDLLAVLVASIEAQGE